ncbi:hypothetical protein NDQ71_00500 [Pseudoalteromonas sp. KG3]|uniref:hypothetical protein n=1 Tax=Pseudoalteromonas sp. KG3 TaxID=2951137 RepID=UPI00265B4566|nr:hypothetical protein [Pseudoalteromonas sp. KG3]WKD23627.1 hypothetical protein NDQ71_00500 [Pseudoalteromonas sp. KG3]
MKLLLKINSGLIEPQLPDSSSLFEQQDVVEINEEMYLFADYTGSKSLVSDYSVDDYLASIAPVETPLIPVIIDNVAGQLEGYVNVENEYTVPQASDAVIATGQLAIPDRKFKVPFKRIDTGRVQLMPAEVVSGAFTLPLKFETNGVWIVNQELINSDYEQDVFALTERRFSVI